MPANHIDPCYDRGDNEGDHESNDFSTPPTIQSRETAFYVRRSIPFSSELSSLRIIRKKKHKGRGIL